MALDSRGVRCSVGPWTQGSVDCYLSLDAIKASEPEDLASTKLPFGMIDLIHVLQLLQLLVWDLLLLSAVARCLQEF